MGGGGRRKRVVERAGLISSSLRGREAITTSLIGVRWRVEVVLVVGICAPRQQQYSTPPPQTRTPLTPKKKRKTTTLMMMMVIRGQVRGDVGRSRRGRILDTAKTLGTVDLGGRPSLNWVMDRRSRPRAAAARTRRRISSILVVGLRSSPGREVCRTVRTVVGSGRRARWMCIGLGVLWGVGVRLTLRV
jgi:hypothetical protein